jgi:integrase
MRTQRNQRRPHGTGSLLVKGGKFYGQWRVNGQLVKRVIGPVRAAGTREGLTKSQAEARLRALIAEVAPPVAERLSVEVAGKRLIAHLTTMGRKPSTLEGYESFLRVHIAPFFGERPLSKIGKSDIEAFMAHCLNAGQSIKSTRNYLGLLHGIFDHAMRQGWASSNPCKLVEKPQQADVDADIRFLDEAEINALLRAVPDTDLGRVERVLYLAAALTGLRQGELLALRWMDVDWPAQRVRVRRNYVRGRLGTPKSKRSSRAVPLADVLGGELDHHYKGSVYQGDADLVFAHPHTGGPMDRSRLLKRYKSALKRAGVREVRFHDLRHTFGTRMAAAGVPMRTLQEWMGHRDFKTTLIYADYAPGANEAALVNAAMQGINSGISLSTTGTVPELRNPVDTGSIA